MMVTPLSKSFITGWISVNDRMPEPGVEVLAHYCDSYDRPKTIRAIWVAAKTREHRGCDDALDCDYDDDADQFYWPEGWYECINNWDDFDHITADEGDITHWMPMPEPPPNP